MSGKVINRVAGLPDAKLGIRKLFDIIREKNMSSAHVVIVGGGLAGQTAALEAAKYGARVTLLEKEDRLGGNSAKATSGINAWGTKAQEDSGVVDNGMLFERDTFLSGRGGNCRPGLVKTLSVKSAEAIEMLTDLGVPLSVLSQLGGHSRKRTHRVPDKEDGTPVPVGFTIVQTIEKYIRTHFSEQIDIVVGARLSGLLHENVLMPTGEISTIIKGVKYKRKGNNHPVDSVPMNLENPSHEPPEESNIITIDADAVVLATGGFSCDKEETSLLDEFAPHLKKFPTTNGKWATGDGVKMARQIGASLVDMDKVQLHPTGLINPKNPKSDTVFLGPEALRGSGGILLNKNGERFVNELDLRSVVSKAILEQGDTYPGSNNLKFSYSVLNQDAASLFGMGALSFYWKKMGLFSRVETISDLAKLIGCNESRLKATLEAYESVSSKKTQACPHTGKNVFPCVVGPSGPFYVAYITPSIHYTMGGCLISPSAEIQSTQLDIFGSRRPILGLFGAGEVTGGVHGGNRLGGNSLLECAVFGKIAGRSAAQIMQHSYTPINSSSWTKMSVSEITLDTENESNFTSSGAQIYFSFPSTIQSSGLQPFQPVVVKIAVNGELQSLYMHPTTHPDELGRIGIYLPCPSKLTDSSLSSLCYLQHGDIIEMKAGVSTTAQGARFLSRESQITELVLIASAPHGTAPLLQALRMAFSPAMWQELKTVHVIYHSQNVSNMNFGHVIKFCQEKQASKYSIPSLKYTLLVDEPPTGWIHEIGFIGESILSKKLPSPEKELGIILLTDPNITGSIMEYLVANSYNPKNIAHVAL